MARKRYSQKEAGTAFGEQLCVRSVPDGHFLRQLEGMVDWHVLYEKLLQLQRGKAQMVRLPCNPSVILKMLLLGHLHDRPERPADTFLNDNLRSKYFLGVALGEPAPDHSALTIFKQQRVRRRGFLTS